MNGTASQRPNLEALPTFRCLPVAALAKLTQITISIACERGRTFYYPDDLAETVYVLEEGRVGVFRLAVGGKRVAVAAISRGEIFGELTIAGRQTYETMAEALTEGIVGAIRRQDLLSAIVEYPEVGVSFLQALGQRLAQAQARVEAIATKGVPARLASLLLELATANGHGQLVLDGLSHEDLAALVGAYRESITVALRQFRHGGLVTVGRRRIILRDPKQLAFIANG